MYMFFAMSGYGLVISYKQRPEYLNNFMPTSLTKLFVPYMVALVVFICYRWICGIDQLALLQENGLYSFVPTSWFIFVLAYFYIFFYIVFRYVNYNIYGKVMLVSILVMAYCLIAPKIGIEYWRYARCPAFCIGMLAAVFADRILRKVRLWQMVIALVCMSLLFPFYYNRSDVVAPLLVPVLFFIVMFLLPEIRSYRLSRFISSISLEMFIIQYIPIYIFMDNLHVESPAVMVTATLILDIVLAYLLSRVAISVRKISWSQVPVIKKLY